MRAGLIAMLVLPLAMPRTASSHRLDEYKMPAISTRREKRSSRSTHFASDIH